MFCARRERKMIHCFCEKCFTVSAKNLRRKSFTVFCHTFALVQRAFILAEFINPDIKAHQINKDVDRQQQYK
jgi:hypothetical protein